MNKAIAALATCGLMAAGCTTQAALPTAETSTQAPPLAAKRAQDITKKLNTNCSSWSDGGLQNACISLNKINLDQLRIELRPLPAEPAVTTIDSAIDRWMGIYSDYDTNWCEDNTDETNCIDTARYMDQVTESIHDLVTALD